MATRRDPSATGLLVRSFASAIRQRFAGLAYAVREAISTKDALGIGGPVTIFNVERKAWQFQSASGKLKSFNAWLLEQIDKGVLAKDTFGDPWVLKFIQQAYQKGGTSAYSEANQQKRVRDFTKFLGSLQEFMGQSFGSTQYDKAKLLATRAYEELKGLTAEVARQMNRILANAILTKQTPSQIAKSMTKQIDGMTYNRALRIARTELVYANAEGQLDAYQKMGVESVGVYAEWETAKDDHVCGLCKPLEGVQFTIEEARGLIPRHPNCRCAWVPSEVAAKMNRRRTMLRKVGDSILAENPKDKRGTKRQRLARVKKQSSWWGKNINGT